MIKGYKRLAAFAIAILLTVSALATAQSSKTAGECEQCETQAVINLNGQDATVAKPLTVQLQSSASLDEALERTVREDGTLRLNVQIQHPGGAWTGLRLFLNAPEANAKTSIETPHYIGSVAFYGGTEGDTETYSLSLDRAVRKLKQSGNWRAGEPLTITLIPLPLNKSSAPAAEGIRVTKVTIKAPKYR